MKPSKPCYSAPAPPCKGRSPNPTVCPLTTKSVPVFCERANYEQGQVTGVTGLCNNRPANIYGLECMKPERQPHFEVTPPCKERSPNKCTGNMKQAPVLPNRANNGQGQVTDVIGVVVIGLLLTFTSLATFAEANHPDCVSSEIRDQD
ncbi:uncharacterized protein [Ptychodera flava]|uniref:uncharacterized protein n=1 Tax=Ptychodera flava TaxID=63121 RepID=UPI003969E602